LTNLNSENYHLQLKSDISIQILLFDYENWYFISNNSYLNLKIDISSLKIMIWIQKFIFEIFFFGYSTIDIWILLFKRISKLIFDFLKIDI